MSTYPQSIQNAIDNPKGFRLGDYAQQGLDIAKQNFGGFIGYMILMPLILGIMQITIIGIIPAILLSGAFTMGYFIVAHKIHTKQSYEFKDFFGGMDFWKQLALLTLLLGLLMSAAILPFLFYTYGGLDFTGLMVATSPGGNPEDAGRIIAANMEGKSFFVMLLLELPIIIIGLGTMFSQFLVVFFNMTAMDSITASFKLAMKHLGWLLLFGIVVGFIVGLGAIACFIGMLFTAPIGICAQYAMMADLTGLNDNATDDTTRHFITE